LLHAAFVLLAHLLLELAHFGEVGVEHAAFAAQGTALGLFAALWFLEERGENLAATTHRGQSHAIGGPGERILRERDSIEGRVCCAVISAIFWSTEIVLRSEGPSLPPVSQTEMQLW
jgi:hypothetical protein